MANFAFRGRVFATPSAATILIDGQEAFSGQVGIGAPLDTEITLAEITTNGGAVSISVTSGVITVGDVYNVVAGNAWSNTATYPAVGKNVTYNGEIYTTIQAVNTPGILPTDDAYWDLTQGFTTDIRDSILINGTPPEWPATPVDPMPGGTSADPNWAGWFFEASAGETITFNAVP